MYTELTNNNSATVDLPILKKGMQGEAVRFLQQHLIAYDYLCAHLLSGRFDSQTEKSVQNLQRDNGLVIDGIVGFYTWRTISSMIPVVIVE